MMRGLTACAALAALATASYAAAADLKFWNLTSATLVDVQLAPLGTQNWSPNQCENDPDKSVDADERLELSGIMPGKYDVKLRDKSGRRCLVRDVEVKGDGHYAFSIGESDLTDCQR